MSQSFHIERIIPSASPENVDVHVRYDGGATVFTFPRTYPKSTILVQVRIELRALLLEADVKKRLDSLVGRHDL
jgi:hypothetical protein